jgi:hypothetical protein
MTCSRSQPSCCFATRFIHQTKEKTPSRRMNGCSRIPHIRCRVGPLVMRAFDSHQSSM